MDAAIDELDERRLDELVEELPNFDEFLYEAKRWCGLAWDSEAGARLDEVYDLLDSTRDHLEICLRQYGRLL